MIDRRFVRAVPYLALLTVSLSLPSCDRGGVARVQSEVGGVAVASVAGGTVPVEVLLYDQQSDPVDVELHYALDGGAWQDATLASPARGLATAPRGARHVLSWDAMRDLGPRASEPVQLSVRATDPATGRVGRAVVVGFEVQNLQAASDRVESYMIHFGAFDAATVALAKAHSLVVLDTCQVTVTRDLIDDIQRGVDGLDPADDVIVLGYVDVGEDRRTIGVPDPDLLSDPRFVGDASGPRVDPRGPGAAGRPLTELEIMGLPSVSGGYASFYLDDNSVETHGVGDGVPDRNPTTGACYVNMGDPAWFATLDEMRCDSADARSGFRELLSSDYGRGLGCDGLYLDNVDTCAPNSYTSPGDPDQAEFEWTAAGYTTLLVELRRRYPEALLLQNRGLFFFSPDLPHYELSPSAALDFVKIENYRLDRSAARTFDPYTFADNKHNFVPKLQAEANRAGGFQVLSLGYAEGPGIDAQALVGGSLQGIAELQQDIVEAHRLAGFRHYLTDAGGTLANRYVRDRTVGDDDTPPVWNSTYNDNVPGYPAPPGAPTPRIGIQQVVPQPEGVRVSWDVALDANPVSYLLRYATETFDFDAADPFASAATLALDPLVGTDYASGSAPGVYPYEAVVPDLEPNTTYYFCIRAVDSHGNEDDNRVVRSATVPSDDRLIDIDGDFRDWRWVPALLWDWRTLHNSDGPDWRTVQLAHDDQFLYMSIRTWDRFDVLTSASGDSSLRVLIDVDDDPFTGWRFSNVGAELVLQGDRLFTPAGAIANGTPLQTIQMLPTNDVRRLELAIPRSVVDGLGPRPAKTLRLIFVNLDSGDLAPDRGHLRYRLAR